MQPVAKKWIGLWNHRPFLLAALCWQAILHYLGQCPTDTTFLRADQSLGWPSTVATGFFWDWQLACKNHNLCILSAVLFRSHREPPLIIHKPDKYIPPRAPDNVAFGTVTFRCSHHLWKYFPTFLLLPSFLGLPSSLASSSPFYYSNSNITLEVNVFELLSPCF